MKLLNVQVNWFVTIKLKWLPHSFNQPTMLKSFDIWNKLNNELVDF